MSNVVLCTLCLNEMEWLPKLYEQHRDWPGMARWVFVEACDVVYASVNLGSATEKGLSVDGTSRFLAELAQMDDRVRYVPFGWTGAEDKAQGKCPARTAYLREADEVRPDYLWVLDADEFYEKKGQERLMKAMDGYKNVFSAYCFRHRHPWRPPSVAHLPWNTYEVRGFFWDIPLCRGWRWRPGLVYQRNHNTPQDPDGVMLDSRMKRLDQRPNMPECCHMAWVSDVKTRHAKNAYYAARGEGKTDHRATYVQSRAAYETWNPGDPLPRKAEVV